MKIDAYREFGMNVDDQDLTPGFAARLPECPDRHLEIDFSRCLIDYEATSRITDAALERLERTDPPRKLVFVFNIKFQERLLLRWLFRGSRRLQLDQGPTTDDEIRLRVIQGLKSLDIELRISIVDPDNRVELHAFTYEE